MSNRSGYEEVEVLRDADGVVAVISKRISNGQYSFMIGKEFDRDERAERTAFIQPRHAEGGIRLIKLAMERIAALEDADRAAARKATPSSQRSAGGRK